MEWKKTISQGIAEHLEMNRFLQTKALGELEHWWYHPTGDSLHFNALRHPEARLSVWAQFALESVETPDDIAEAEFVGPGDDSSISVSGDRRIGSREDTPSDLGTGSNLTDRLSHLSISIPTMATGGSNADARGWITEEEARNRTKRTRYADFGVTRQHRDGTTGIALLVEVKNYPALVLNNLSDVDKKLLELKFKHTFSQILEQAQFAFRDRRYNQDFVHCWIIIGNYFQAYQFLRHRTPVFRADADFATESEKIPFRTSAIHLLHQGQDYSTQFKTNWTFAQKAITEADPSGGEDE